MSTVFRRWAPPLGALVLIGFAWEATVRLFHIAPYLLPAPSAIWTAFNEVKNTLPANIETTLDEAVLGLLAGAMAGAIIAAILWAWPFARRTLFPLLVASQTVPMVVLAPLLVLWFGLGLLPKVIVVALTTFFPVSVATVQGLTSTDPELMDLLVTMGAKRRHFARLALIPSAAPSFFAGLRIAAGYSVAAAVIGEWVGASSGIGLLVTRAQHSFRIDRVLVAVVVIAALSIALFTTVDVVARLAMPWHHANQNRQQPSRKSS